MELNLRQLIRLARRWWWLLLLCPFVAGVVAYAVETRREPAALSTYTARTTLLINPSRATNAPLYSAGTYGRLVKTTAVLTPVVADLQLPFGVEQLQRMVSAAPELDGTLRTGQAELLTIVVVDTDAPRASDIANAVARSFTTYIADQTVALNDPYRTALARQVDDTKRQIDEIGQQIQTLEQGPNATDSAIVVQLGTLHAQLNDLQQSYAQLLLTAQTMDLNAASAQSQLVVVEPATPPLTPNPVAGSLPATPLGAIAGLIFAAAMILLIEYLDNTVKATTDFQTVVGTGLLSVIPRLRRLRSGHGQLFVQDQPGAPASEAIRLLRTNLEFVGSLRRVKMLAVSSPSRGDGKSTVVANLGLAAARAGLTTVLIDADLRNPSLHRIFNLPNTTGLTSLLVDPGQSWRKVAADYIITPNLRVIPSGPVPVNPADLLSLGRLREILDDIAGEADAILIDTPALPAMSDALVVAAHVDGVILVCRSGRTRIDALLQAVDALHRGGGRLVGVVVNGQIRREDGSYATTSPSRSQDRTVALPTRLSRAAARRRRVIVRPRRVTSSADD